jgi:hypothetical protein
VSKISAAFNLPGSALRGMIRAAPIRGEGRKVVAGSIALLACVALSGCGGGSGDAQAAQGGGPGIANSAGDPQVAATADNAFGAREPRPCPNRKFDGPPTARQALDIVICASEKYVGGYEYLVSNVTVQIGKGRPYSAGSDDAASDIDPSAAVYPIQGRVTSYQCNRRDAMLGQDPSRNCLRTDTEGAMGNCYKNTFGEWRCLIVGVGAMAPGYQPPPTAG